ncbi:hypothetical protein MCOR04_011491, partial [Pyricularia oryzae]
MLREILALMEKVLGPENPSTFGGMDNLASVFNRQGKYEEVEKMFREALAFYKK